MKTLKKVLAVILTMMMVITFASCGKSGTEQTTAFPGTTAAPGTTASKAETARPTIPQKNLVIVGGSSSAVWTIAAAQIGEMIKETYDVTINVEPGGAIANYTAVNNGAAELGLCVTSTSWEAWNGGTEVFPEKLQNVRTWGISWPMSWHCIATEKSGIETVYDLKGHSISASFPGQTAYVVGTYILDMHGIDILKDVKLSGQESSDALPSMKDGLLDVYAWNHSIPQASLVELATNTKVRFVKWGDGKLDEFLEKYPQYAKITIPGGTYTFAPEDYDTVGIVSDLIVHKDIDEEFVYNMTKSYWEQQERFLNIMRQAQSYATLETAMSDLTVPLHPGAYRYYVEVGCDVPDRIKPID